MDARDVEIVVPKPFDPKTDIGAPPAYFQGASQFEMTTVRFRCPHCGIAQSAGILPHSPQIAKYKCRRCENVLEIATRPSVMDSIEDEVELRKDMGRVENHPKSFSKQQQAAREAALIFAKLK